MDHRDKQKHHDSELQAGPAYPNFAGDAQGRSDQRAADEIYPKQTPWHVNRHDVCDELRAEEM